MTHQAPTLEEITATRELLGSRIIKTPVTLSSSPALRRMLGNDTEVFFKLELFQHGGSFKPRGALAVMESLSTEERQGGVTAISAGNHAIAVGYAAKMMSIHAKVVMPSSASPIRVERARSLGAEVLLTPDIHTAFEKVWEIEREEKRFFVHPFEGPFTTRGTATLGLELCEQVPGLDAVIIPIGGGGLCAGVATAIKAVNPKCRIFGVEPFGADTMTRGFASGKPEKIDKVRTIADSLGAPHGAPYSLALCRAALEEIVLVDDDALCRSLALLFHEAKLAVEPAGAAATAALCGPLRQKLEGLRVGIIVCGANIDRENFSSWLARGEQSMRERGEMF